LVLQTPFLDCVALDPFSLQQDFLTAPEVHVRRREIAQAHLGSSFTRDVGLRLYVVVRDAAKLAAGALSLSQISKATINMLR
jgi:hypothetical protein